jgi:hypothetical protein
MSTAERSVHGPLGDRTRRESCPGLDLEGSS